MAAKDGYSELNIILFELFLLHVLPQAHEPSRLNFHLRFTRTGSSVI